MNSRKAFICFILLAISNLANARSWNISLPVRADVAQSLSPDMKQLAIAPIFGPIIIFSTETGEIITTHARPSERAYSLAWQANGHGFYYGNPDAENNTRITAFGNDTPKKNLPGGSHQLSPSQNGQWLASIDYDTLIILNLHTNKLETWMGKISNVLQVLWDNDNTLVVIQSAPGFNEPAILRFDLAHKKSLPTIALPRENKPTTGNIVSDNHQLWLGTEQGHLLGIDLVSGKIKTDRELSTKPIRNLAVSQEGHIAAWVEDKILLADVHEPNDSPQFIPAWTSNQHHGWKSLLAWQNNDLLIASGSNFSASNQWKAEKHENAWDIVNNSSARISKRFNSIHKKATNGDTDAQFTLGEYYSDGYGVEQNNAQAIAWWLKAAEAGSINAQNKLGEVYITSTHDVPRDIPKGHYWWKKAADQYRKKAEAGDTFAASALADMYAKGKGVHRDSALAYALALIADNTKQTKWSEKNKELISHLQSRLDIKKRNRVTELLQKWKPGSPLPTDMRASDCEPLNYTQAGFKRTIALREFYDFQARFRMNMDTFNQSNDLKDTHDQTDAIKILRKIFSDSVANGPKGDGFLSAIASPGPGGRIVSPMHVMLDYLQNDACPVGFGGTFIDGGQTVELWYVQYNPNDNDISEIFKNFGLPAYGETRRNVFPALVFIRDEHRKLKLFGMSQEMVTVLNYWFNIQIQ